MPHTNVSFATPDGICPATVFTPEHQSGPFSAVIFYMDGFGIRPTILAMAQRLAELGYLVLLPDLYYRHGSYATMVPEQVLADPLLRAEFMQLIASQTHEHRIADAGACLDYLTTRDDIKGTQFALTGYCLGGSVALTVAGAFPGKVAAIASFHGGNLASDKPDSPHLFVGGITGQVYIGAAINDPTFPEQQQLWLAQALTSAKVPYVIDTYQALHGYAVPDHPSFNASAAERHWAELSKLLSATLS